MPDTAQHMRSALHEYVAAQSNRQIGGESVVLNLVLTDSMMSPLPLAGVDNQAALCLTSHLINCLAPLFGECKGQAGVMWDSHLQSHANT